MANEFDPYHRWLGIPKQEQPPNHYRLMGIPLFEDDPLVIEAAADRTMAFLRKFQSGEHKQLANELLNQISKARLCLLKPPSKSQYDQVLRQQLTTDADAEEAPEQQDSFAGIEIQVSERPLVPLWRRKSTLAGSGLVLACTVIGLLYLAKSKPREDAPAKMAQASSPAIPSESQEALPASRNPESQPHRTREIPVQEKSSNPSSHSPTEPPTSKISENEIDLLATVDVSRDAVNGVWELRDRVLISPVAPTAIIGIPAKAPPTYTLTIEATPTGDFVEGIHVVLPIAGRQVVASIDGWSRTISGLSDLEGLAADRNKLARSGTYTKLGINTFVFRVTTSSILAEVNETKVFEWRGDPKDLSLSAGYVLPHPDQFAIGAVNSAWEFRRISLLPETTLGSANTGKLIAKGGSENKPKDTQSPPLQDKSTQATPDKPNVVATETGKNLVTTIDPARDAVQGTWRIEDDKLIAPRGFKDRIRLATTSFPAYMFTMIAERKRSEGMGLAVILPVGSQQVLAGIDCWDGQTSGLEFVNGLSGNGNKTTKPGRVFKAGRNRLVATVQPGGVQVTVNGTKVLSWTGDPKTLQVPFDFGTTKPDEIGLAVVGGEESWTISSIQIESLNLKPNSVESHSDSIQGSLAIEKQPVPEKPALDLAKKELLELYKSDYISAKKIEGKAPLARTLLIRGQEIDDNPAITYVMLSESARLAAEVGQLAPAWEAVFALRDRFEFNHLPLMEQVASKSLPFAKSITEIQQLSFMYVELIQEAMRANEFELAIKAMQSISQAVRKPLYTNIKDNLASINKRLTAMKEAFDVAKPARDELRTNPDSASACLTWGRFLCLAKGNWSAGLPILAKGTECPLTLLAKQELQYSDLTMVDHSELTQLGDAWWELAEQEKEPIRTIVREHSVDVFYRAQSLTTGLAKATLHRKIERIFGSNAKFAEASGEKDGVPLAAAEYNPGTFFTVEFWVNTNSNSGNLIMKRIDGGSALQPYVDGGHAGLANHADFHWHPVTSDAVINDGHWHHIAVVKVAEKCLLFVDGIKQAEHPALDSYSTPHPWYFGRESHLGPLTGRLCRFRLSSMPRYITNFYPEKQYTKDAATLFVQ